LARAPRVEEDAAILRCTRILILAQFFGMIVTYELTQKDFYESLVAHGSRSALRRWIRRIVLFTLGGLVVLVLVAPPYAGKFSTLAFLFLIAALLVVCRWPLLWWAARNQYLKQPAAHGSKTMSADAAGVRWQWNGGSSDAQWTNYIRYLESKRQFLLYLSPAFFIIVPKRAFAPEQVSEFRALLAQKLPRTRQSNEPQQV